MNFKSEDGTEKAGNKQQALARQDAKSFPDDGTAGELVEEEKEKEA